MWKPNSITEYLRKILCFQLMEGKRSHSEWQDSLLFILRRPALRRNDFSKLLTIGVAVPNLTGGREIPNSSSFKLFMWVKGLTLLQSSLAILSHLRGPSGEGLQGTGEGHSPGAQTHSKTKPQPCDYRILPPSLHLPITLPMTYLPQCLLPSTSCPPFNTKLQNTRKCSDTCEETKQTWESDMTGTLELSY